MRWLTKAPVMLVAVAAAAAWLDGASTGAEEVDAEALSRRVTLEAVKQLFTLLDDEDLQFRRLAASSLKTLQERLAAEEVPEGQLPLGLEQTLSQLLSTPPQATELPRAFVELVGGDRLACRVVGYSPGDESPGACIEPHLIVRPHGVPGVRILGTGASLSGPSLSGDVRISTRWVRRVVWQRQNVLRHSPGTVLLRDGGRLRFRTLRWSATEVVVLTTDGIQRLDFKQIAELHLPETDSWNAYFEQLAILGCDEAARLLRLDEARGSRLTVSLGRFLPFHDTSASDPRDWAHALRPAWSLDPLAVRHLGLSLRSFLPARVVPLSVPRGNASVRPAHWPWQANGNVQGQVLASGGREYRWGVGVHADCTLQFTVPPCATGFQTGLGLDHMVGDGGCARALVRARSNSRVQTLYRSPLLQGSDAVLDTGYVELRPGGSEMVLELVADSAHDARPAEADPLNIGDMVDWLEPCLYLDEDQLKQAVSSRAAELVPAREDWRVAHGEGKRLRLASDSDSRE